MIIYFDYDDKYSKAQNIREEKCEYLNSRGYFWLPSQTDAYRSRTWIDPEIFKKSDDYNSFYCDFLKDFVDNTFPIWLRKYKLKRILK